MFEIIKTVTVRDSAVFVNDVLFFQYPEAVDTTDFLKEFYRCLKPDYLKFFKMDNLSKLGFLAAELLLEGIGNKEDFGIILSTSSSSLDTDTAFQDTIRNAGNFFPSPSVFVYTLPNIVIGEICIRHKIHGENMMFIVHENDTHNFYRHTQNLMNEMEVKQGITGYLDCYKNHYHAEFRLFQNSSCV